MLDPETANKVLMLKKDSFKKLHEFIPPDQLEVKYGGTHPNITDPW